MNNDVNNIDLILGVITILSFVLQLENNEQLQQQSTNDDILQRLHNDVMNLLEDNRKLFNVVIKQNNEILDYLKGEYYHDKQKRH